MDKIQYGMPTLIELEGIEDNIKLCSELGLSFIELNMNLPTYQPGFVNAEHFSKLAEKHHIAYTIHLPENMDPFVLNDQLRDTWKRFFIDSVHLAKDLKSQVLNMHMDLGIYFTMPDHKIYLYERYRDKYIKNIKAFTSLVAEHLDNTDIILCIENTGIYDRAYITHALEVLLSCDRIYLTWDIGHDYTANNVDSDFIKDHMSKLKHMHFHDAKANSNHLAIGKGNIDFDAMVTIARGCGTRCVLETKTIDGLKESFKALKTIDKMI